MGKDPNARRFQDDLEQYKMDNVLNAPKNYVYRVGYEASTGNSTEENNISKKTRELKQ